MVHLMSLTSNLAMPMSMAARAISAHLHDASEVSQKTGRLWGCKRLRTSWASCLLRRPCSLNFSLQTMPVAELVMRMTPPWST